MTAARTTLLALASRVEAATGADAYVIDALCREVHEIDPRRPVNGSCRDYLRSPELAALLTMGAPYAVTFTGTETRAFVGGIPWEEWGGSSYVEGHAPGFALTAASLRALATETPA